MRRSEALQGVRVMRFLDILGRYESAEFNQMEAAELLGIDERTFRRWRQRFEDDGEAGLMDRRLGKASGRRVPVDRADEVEALYRERYQGFTAKHFHEHLVAKHKFAWSYTWTKTFLHSKGLLEKAKRRGAHRRKRAAGHGGPARANIPQKAMWSAAMDVGVWLRGLGLEKYEGKFRDNAIDADLLPRLTGDHLKDIGVSALGDRLRLLDAIAALAAKPVSPASSRVAQTKRPELSAERRPITVLFCDLVGSTSLAARLDAEDWRSLVNAYLDAASKAVAAFGGHVLKRLGDGLMGLFGYPHAQENDTERAVRAALAIQRALAELARALILRDKKPGSLALDVRRDEHRTRFGGGLDARGEVRRVAKNFAVRLDDNWPGLDPDARFQLRRAPGGVIGVELKGVAEPVQLFRIVRASGGGRRGGVRALTPFVGREEELAMLARRWERTLAGEGQLVLIVGEPGFGKSRLIEEFHARLKETPHTWSVWGASQLLQNTPLHPITEWGRQRFGADASADERLADLEGTLRLIGLDPAEYAPLLAPLVDIPLPPEHAANFPPEELQKRQMAAMTAWVLAGARSQPIVFAFEDLHWADPTSLDLLRALAERGAQAPLLILATARPEFRPPWSLRSHHSVISLAPLDRADVARMVGQIAARHALSSELIEGVSERTGGVPLFVEEVTRLLLERGEEGGAHAIPPTLQQSLAARLDRLGDAREIAQIGAVLGRAFSYGPHSRGSRRR